ncbi:MAG: dienelactone hydrolase family protein [Candidatus Hydrogenedentota bacterium]
MTKQIAFATVFFVTASAIGGCATTMSGKIAEEYGIPTGFLNKTIEVRGEERPYAVYVPRNYDPSKAWPLIVFLHGAGERGDDGLLQTEVGLPSAIRRNAKRFPAIVVMPQCPKGVWWDKAIEDVERAYALTREEYNIDPDRIYLTGLSMGGYATWQYGAQHIDRWAALMPICGGGNVKDAPILAKVPIWAFHGADDETVNPEESRKMVEAVKQAGGNIRYAEFENTGHNSWDQAYRDKKVIRWLFNQEK